MISQRPDRRLASPISWVFAVINLRKGRGFTLFAPVFLPARGGLPEVVVPFREIPIDRRLSLVDRLVITVVDDGPRHAAKYGLNHVQELGAELNLRVQFRNRDEFVMAVTLDGDRTDSYLELAGGHLPLPPAPSGRPPRQAPV